LNLRGNYVRNGENGRKLQNKAEYQPLTQVIRLCKCPDYFQMSGMEVQRKTSGKANDYALCTPKPDRITANQVGCRVQRA
jgi:hypothetical protein